MPEDFGLRTIRIHFNNGLNEPFKMTNDQLDEFRRDIAGGDPAQPVLRAKSYMWNNRNVMMVFGSITWVDIILETERTRRREPVDPTEDVPANML